MCGIIGGTNFTKDNLRDGLKKIKHRGRDDSGIFNDSRIFLGHNRLAIIDLSKEASQPFEVKQKDKSSLYIIFNGEIWNYIDLKKELICNGHIFFTKSDTEVLLRSYIEWGMDFIKKIDGMFAFAIYDQAKNELILARDWVGKIPLHYIYQNNELSFASEIKAFKDASLAKIFPPAHYLIFNLENKKAVFKKYYSISKIHTNDSFENATKKTRELLIEGVSKRLISDVPFCTLLSGGIDSFIITFIVRNFLPNVEAYTISWDKLDKRKDLYYAQKAAKWLGIKLNKILVTEKEVLKELPQIIYALESDKYYQVYAAVANYFLAKKIAKDGYKITFSGEGSDELWGSYDTTRKGSGLSEFKQTRRYLIENIHKGNLNRINKVMMYGGTIETRSPFLHRPLVEYCLNLPESYITKGSERKYLLKESFKNIVPLEFLQRPKITIQDGSGITDIFEKFILNSKYNKKKHANIEMIFSDIFNKLFTTKQDSSRREV